MTDCDAQGVNAHRLSFALAGLPPSNISTTRKPDLCLEDLADRALTEILEASGGARELGSRCGMKFRQELARKVNQHSRTVEVGLRTKNSYSSLINLLLYCQRVLSR
jgi:hypothetical protein